MTLKDAKVGSTVVVSRIDGEALTSAALWIMGITRDAKSISAKLRR